jgi:carboxypeptidase family protein
MSRRIAVLLGVVLSVALPVWGQTQITTGVIQGTVSDQSGALVPGAGVEARNVETNAVRAQTTGGDGRFVFLQLRPGRYTLAVTLQGFATHVQEDVTLTVGQSVTLNPVLKVSGTAETVTVTGSSFVDLTRTEVVVWSVFVRVSTCGGNLFPSVLLQPLGHLFELRARAWTCRAKLLSGINSLLRPRNSKPDSTGQQGRALA